MAKGRELTEYSRIKVYICLVPRPHYSARPMRFGSRDASEEVERAWKDAVQGLGKVYIRVKLALNGTVMER